jgi:hypothetical protein
MNIAHLVDVLNPLQQLDQQIASVLRFKNSCIVDVAEEVEGSTLFHGDPLIVNIVERMDGNKLFM